MKYLIDTNIVAAYFRPKTRDTILARIEAERPGTIVTSAIVAHELYYGAHHGRHGARNMMRLNEFFLDVEALPFTHGDADTAGRIRADLRAKGTPIGPYDVLIAGQALARNLVLVTNNTREFARVEYLQTEDWTAE